MKTVLPLDIDIGMCILAQIFYNSKESCLISMKAAP